MLLLRLHIQCSPILPQTAFRAYGTAAVVDQMVEYALRQCKGKHDQACDVLKSGLSMTGEHGLDSARLTLALAGVEADRSNWSEVVALAGRAAATLRSVGAGEQQQWLQELQLRRSSLAVAGLMAKGRDEEAVAEAAALQGQVSSPQLHAQARGLQLLAQAAAGDAAAATSASELSRLTADAASTSSSGSTFLPHYASACWKFHQGDAAGAEPGFTAAAEAAAAARQACQGQTAPLFSEADHSEGEAAALTGVAHVAISSKQWDRAEEVLGRALKAAEATGSESHPRVASVLVLLGQVYSRTTRVTFAEGLYREAAKMIKLDAAKRAQGYGPTQHLVHPSLAALLAWRYHQLLTALPNRANEASSWQHVADDLLKLSAAGAAPPSAAAVMGASEQLKGRGGEGSGALVLLGWRRALLLKAGA